MKKLIAEFPQNIVDAVKIAENMKFSKPQNEIRNIVICGMGGSGIGGRLVSEWVQMEIKIPMLFVQDYDLPAFVDQNSLVIGSSYSGNTEETLSSIAQAFERGSHVVGICSGGLLEEFCKKNNVDVVIVPGGNPPRSALAFSVIQLISLFTQLNLISGESLKSIEKGRNLLIQEKENIDAEAHQVARFLKDKVIAIYAPANYEAVAIRARQQFNENGKLLCWHHVIPEMNHNELVGWGGGDDRFGALFLDTQDWNPRNNKRLEFSLAVVKSKTENVLVLKAKGNSVIERSLYIIHVVDWASWYLSELKSVDAMDIKVIDSLKNTLSKF
jgi:glucose/mannose-6-phosphate isomerase